MSVHEPFPRASTSPLPRTPRALRDALPFDFVAAKVQPPTPRPGSVSRTGLVNRLRANASHTIVAVVAPAGSGKTTLLAQWADRDDRPFAWVSIDARDDDPVVLLRHVAAALDRVVPLDSSIIDPLRFPGLSVWKSLVPRLGAHVATLDDPVVLVLDGVHLLQSDESAECLVALSDHLSERSLLVLAGRSTAQLPIARLRAGGRLLEICADELALSPRETHLLLRSCDVELTEDSFAELLDETEGWATGVYLAALSGEATGDDRFVADYLRSELLDGLSPERRAFLRRTAVLERMSGPLCDAVLQRTGSARELERIERANLLLVPLDRRGQWYRYHHLFHDLLRQELLREEPERVADLNRRAADWFEADRDPEAALGPAAASGDTDRVARLVSSVALGMCSAGRIETAAGWLDRFDSPGLLERYPSVAVLGTWVQALRGRAADAERRLAAAEQGTPEERVCRAALCGEGAEQMLTDAEAAVAALPPSSAWRPAALLLAGMAHVLLRDDERADVLLSDAAEAAESLGATDVRLIALAERSLIAARLDDHAAAEALASADERCDTSATSAIAHAASARVLLRAGRSDETRAELAAARRLTPSLTHALPWLAVQTRLELAEAYVALCDADDARAQLAEARAILRRRPRLGILAQRARRLRREVANMPGPEASPGSGLTSAELRLLPLLATHLSFREIGERLFVSRNTIKTQAISVYRKLGVSSRSDAIGRAAELGLVDASTITASNGFTPTG